MIYGLMDLAAGGIDVGGRNTWRWSVSGPSDLNEAKVSLNKGGRM
jgi:hypothetical protein